MVLIALLAGLLAPAGQSSAERRPHASVWAVGDAGIDRPAARRLARRVRAAHPRRFLYLGDVYEHGTAEDFRRNYAPLYGALARRTRPTPGNHDWPLARHGYFPYWRRALGRRWPGYYSFRAGGWRLISLNSELRGRSFRRQLRWVRRRLRGGGDCRIAYWHRPRFSAGLHGDAPDLEPLWRAVRGRVRLVLNGHDHDLQRLRRIGGTTTLIAGAGGRSRYALDRGYPRLTWGNDRAEGALRLRLSPGRARFAFVSAGGRVLDRGGVRCR
ncbi:MAG: metallophosphoesterase [Thermoleophilaceae bacterium]